MNADTPVVTVIVVVFVALITKIIWNFLAEEKKIKKAYLTVEAFDKHLESCCAARLKQDLAACQKESIASRATMASQITEHARQLESGEDNFQLLRKDIKEVNSKVDRLIGVVEGNIERIRHG